MQTSNRKNLYILAFSLAVVMLGFGTVIPIMPFYVERLGAGGTELGLLVASYAVMRLIFGPIWGSLSDRIGRKPILAGGNADGDIEMLWYSETSGDRSLQLVLHHDDPDREYAYEGASARKVFPLARERGWTVISMKNDWREVF